MLIYFISNPSNVGSLANQSTVWLQGNANVILSIFAHDGQTVLDVAF